MATGKSGTIIRREKLNAGFQVTRDLRYDLDIHAWLCCVLPTARKKKEMNLCQYDNHAPGRLTCFYKSLTIFSLKKKKTQFMRANIIRNIPFHYPSRFVFLFIYSLHKVVAHFMKAAIGGYGNRFRP
jgi:hypothetical protein